MLVFDNYILLNIVPKFVIHLKLSQSLLRNHNFKIQKSFKVAAPTTVQSDTFSIFFIYWGYEIHFP